MDEFEKYLHNNQRKLDLDHINPAVWQAIRSKARKKRSMIRPMYKRLWGLVGTILLAIGSFYWFGNDQSISFPDRLLEAYGFEDSNVANLLANKIDSINLAIIPVDYKNDLQSLLEQVKFLDQHYEHKLDQLKKGKDETALVTEVLDYYKTKSEILDKVINEIQKINNNERKYDIESEKTYIRM